MIESLITPTNVLGATAVLSLIASAAFFVVSHISTNQKPKPPESIDGDQKIEQIKVGLGRLGALVQDKIPTVTFRSLPLAAVQSSGVIFDMANPVLLKIAQGGTSVLADPDVEALWVIAGKELPKVLDLYLTFAPETRQSVKNLSGRTPDEELAHQLGLIEHGMRKAATTRHADTSSKMEEHGRYLASRHEPSALDLGPLLKPLAEEEKSEFRPRWSKKP